MTDNTKNNENETSAKAIHAAGHNAPKIQETFGEIEMLTENPGFNESGSLIRFGPGDKNATEQKSAADSYMALFSMMRDGYVINNGSGEILSPNPAYLEMFGYTREELVLLSWRDLTPQKSLDLAVEIHG
ncbi:MAG TPA: PAS domain S-box protein [Gammaproteobacteria bacterium]|nr:PAS domain S-box protein [Gammaproteobacteria bacterium]